MRIDEDHRFSGSGFRRRRMLNRIWTIVTAAGIVAAAATPALAQGGGNGAPSGGHYSLNIIGVENSKTSPMTDSHRHTIFVALGRGGTVRTDILLEPGAEFRVCDGNGFDPAISCSGAALGRNGAVFSLPCNENLPTGGTIDHDGDPMTPEIPIELLECDEVDENHVASYQVWARALGKPGGSAKITTCATEVGDENMNGILNEEICSLENVVLTRAKRKSSFINVTNELTSLVACFDTDDSPLIEDISCFRYALFRDEFTDWLWAYENTGLRLAQIRLYLIGD
jgi:hypothetical protein